MSTFMGIEPPIFSTRWWQLKDFFIFIPTLGSFFSNSTVSYVSNGLVQPPTFRLSFSFKGCFFSKEFSS